MRLTFKCESDRTQGKGTFGTDHPPYIIISVFCYMSKSPRLIKCSVAAFHKSFEAAPSSMLQGIDNNSVFLQQFHAGHNTPLPIHTMLFCCKQQVVWYKLHHVWRAFNIFIITISWGNILMEIFF